MNNNNNKSQQQPPPPQKKRGENYLQLKYRKFEEYLKIHYSISSFRSIWLPALLVILFLSIGIYFVTVLYREKYNPQDIDDISNYTEARAHPTSTLYFFLNINGREPIHEETKRAHHQWNAFTRDKCVSYTKDSSDDPRQQHLYRTKNSKHVIVDCVVVDCSDANDDHIDLIARFNISKFPALVLINGAPSDPSSLNEAISFFNYTINVASIVDFLENNATFKSAPWF